MVFATLTVDMGNVISHNAGSCQILTLSYLEVDAGIQVGLHTYGKSDIATETQ